MKSKKIKVFLGGYINNSNAQNLVCLTLAKNINKEKFQVYTLAIKHGNFGQIKIPEVKQFNCYYPVKLTQYLGYLWGICKCEVAYLPRGNNFRYQQFLLKIFRRKSFKTTDNIIDDESLKTALSIFPNLETVYKSYNFTDKLYAITKHMKQFNSDKLGLKYEETILPSPTDIETFRFDRRKPEALREVVFMGNDMKRKRVIDVLQLSLSHPDIIFHIIGKDNFNIVKSFLEKHNCDNVKVYGLLDYSAISKILRSCQLHILPSRSEGFPMGIIITAASSIPTITYTGYGAEEWIDNYVNGVVCKDFNELKHVFLRFQDSSKLLHDNMINARRMSEDFSPESITKLYEHEIIKIYNESS